MTILFKPDDFEILPFVPNDPPVSGYDRLYGREGIAWRHTCGKEGSMSYRAVLHGWNPHCTDCGIGPYAESEE